jgi:hypothetical protein
MEGFYVTQFIDEWKVSVICTITQSQIQLPSTVMAPASGRMTALLVVTERTTTWQVNI